MINMDKNKRTKEELLKEEMKPRVDIIKEVNILYDGRQNLIKIPKEISRFYNIKKGDKLRLIVKPISKGKGINKFSIIK